MTFDFSNITYTPELGVWLEDIIRQFWKSHL